MLNSVGILTAASLAVSLPIVAQPRTGSFDLERLRHPLAAPGVRDAERVREIDRVARTLSKRDAFSGVVLVANADSIIYLAAFGQKDKKSGVPIRADTHFPLASITKTFLTVSIAKLAEEGKVSWDDQLGKFFPDFPFADARDKVRLRHLLTHTSGLREFERLPSSPDSMDDYVRTVTVAQRESLLHEPGTRAIYTNSNFVLLGKIVEMESGRPFHEYIREHIFAPAGMRHTFFDLESYPAPFSGSRSIAGDLLRFASALTSGRILRTETADLLFSPKPEAGNWGYGFDVLDADRGLVGHGGSWVGISNTLDLFRKSGYTVVILSNYTSGRSPLREVLWTILP